MMNDPVKMKDDEWLETDGLGGFASGTVAGIRTRRYHALLLTATNPPSGRVVLVNGFDAWVETTGGRFSLSSQLYNPDVVHPDGVGRIEQFKLDPWPQWTYRLEDGTKIKFEIFVCNGVSLSVLAWRLLTPKKKTILCFRPFFSGRDYHSLHCENGAFQFEPQLQGKRLIWHPYSGLPGIIALANGEYHHEPDLYRNFLYQQERARGLDFIEDLAAPGLFRCDLARAEAVCILAAEGFDNGLLAADESAETGGGSAWVRASPPAEIFFASGTLRGRLPGQARRRQNDCRGLSLVHRLGPRYVHCASWLVPCRPAIR
jgi:predicted glycogen debranching enzyme